MPSSIIQRSFAAGEIGPPLYGRADQVKYQTGLKKCRNYFVMRHGGVSNRPGSQFIAEVNDSTARTYLMKFVFNDEQTYVIEMGDEYFRFYRHGAQILVSGVAAWATTTAYEVGDLASSGGVNYYCTTDHTAGATFAGDAANWYALTGSIYEIPTPYVSADLASLKFVQSGDIVTITHPNYEPMELARTGHTTWTLTAISFAPTIVAPTGVSNSGGAGSAVGYRVTAVAAETYEESLQSANTLTADTASSGSPVTVTWNAVTGAQEYNVYKSIGGQLYGFIGTTASLSFVDDGIQRDASITPPRARNPFSGSGNYPSTATYYQQRRVFANTDNNPEGVWGSKTGMPKNMTISSPLRDDDAITFSIKGRKVNEIQHMVEVDELVILTSGGEWVALTDSDGVLRANQPPNLKQRSYNGSSEVVPVIIGNTIVYVQARGAILRDFRQDLNEGSKSKDLSIFSPHLFEGYTIDRMDYAQIPHSIVWCVRSDGALLALTYLREHEIAGWAWADTDGSYEDICCVPEGDEDAIYVVVKRTIDGQDKRYIERFASRRFTDVAIDACFLDSFLTYDGRNTDSTTLTLTSAGGSWTHDDEITVTASGATWAAGDVGNVAVVRITDDDGTEHEARIEIASYTGATEVKGFPSRDVPAALQGVATTDWGRAVDALSGLDHLEGVEIGFLADGNVLSRQTVSGGAIASLGRCYEVIHAGIPYDCDFQTLDLDVEGEQTRDRRKKVDAVSLLVDRSRGGFIGPDEDHLTELKTDTPIGDPLEPVTGIVEVNITATWERSGSFMVRQSDPLPLTILSAIPCGTVGG